MKPQGQGLNKKISEIASEIGVVRSDISKCKSLISCLTELFFTDSRLERLEQFFGLASGIVLLDPIIIAAGLVRKVLVNRNALIKSRAELASYLRTNKLEQFSHLLLQGIKMVRTLFFNNNLPILDSLSFI